MFRAVNTESETERRKALQERAKIQSTYLSAMKTLDIEKYLEIRIQFEQNDGLYLAGKANLLYGLVRKTPVVKLDELVEKYRILETRLAFFELARRWIDNGMFVKARKLLNMARERGWWCNDLFDLEGRIEREYFPGLRLKKQPKFEDYL